MSTWRPQSAVIVVPESECKSFCFYSFVLFKRNNNEFKTRPNSNHEFDYKEGIDPSKDLVSNNPEWSFSHL